MTVPAATRSTASRSRYRWITHFGLRPTYSREHPLEPADGRPELAREVADPRERPIVGDAFGGATGQAHRVVRRR